MKMKIQSLEICEIMLNKHVRKKIRSKSENIDFPHRKLKTKTKNKIKTSQKINPK